MKPFIDIITGKLLEIFSSFSLFGFKSVMPAACEEISSCCNFSGSIKDRSASREGIGVCCTFTGSKEAVNAIASVLRIGSEIGCVISSSESAVVLFPAEISSNCVLSVAASVLSLLMELSSLTVLLFCSASNTLLFLQIWKL